MCILTLPQTVDIFTCTREITSIVCDIDGTLWAGTHGGILHLADGKWKTYTMLDGLPSNEVQQVWIDNRTIHANTVKGTVVLNQDRWSPSTDQPQAITWDGKTIQLKFDRIQVGLKKFPITAIPSGTHFTSCAVHGQNLAAAVYGSGVWETDGTSWKQIYKDPEVTAIAFGPKGLAVGTRTHGVTFFGSPTPNQPDCLPDQSIQAIETYAGKTWVSTLEHGLASWDGKSWTTFETPTLSTNNPRQLVKFKDALVVRHSTGTLDFLRGGTWTKQASKSLLGLAEVTAVATTSSRIYIGNWQGISSSEGPLGLTNWLPVKGIPIVKSLTGIYAEPDRLWLGTQGKGAISIAKGIATQYREPSGLTDDWVTSISGFGDTVLAGTFIGGLFRFEGNTWIAYPELSGENVTAIEPDSQGNFDIATRHGLWHLTASKLTQTTVAGLDPEIQSLRRAGRSLWIGTRNGLYRVTD